MNLLEIARRYLDAGLSICPVSLDGSKKPLVAWADLSKRLPTTAEVEKWFSHPAGIAIIGGKVSGNLERIDFDEPGAFDEYRDLCKDFGILELLENLPLVQTPRDPGCYHLYYRCEQAVENNQVLAAQSKNGSKKTIIETRGEGGYTIAPGSPRAAHSTNNPYVLVKNDLLKIPVISATQRKLLLSIARILGDAPEPKRTARKKKNERSGGGLSPGDDFDARGDWRGYLETAGWAHLFTRRDIQFWRRPGKTDNGPSATFNYKSSNTFYVFSSNAQPFEYLKSYSPFGIYAILNHAGDFKAAAKALSAQGYGDKIKRLPLSAEKRIAKTQAGLDKATGEIREALCDDDLATYPQTDLGNAERFIARQSDCTFYCPERAGWFVWDGMRWSPESNGGEVRLAAATVRKIGSEADTIKDDDARLSLYKHAARSESEQKIKSLLGLAKNYMAVSLRELDKDHHLLNVQNGTIDLESGRLQDHDRGDKISLIANVAFDSKATCPKWMGFLDFVFGGDATLIKYIQRVAGYAMSGFTSEQCLFFLHGDGANGKSTLLTTLEKLLGGYAASTPTSTLLVKQNEGIPNDIARLDGARFVTAIEADAGKRLAESLLKQLTGSDTITARFMRAEFFQFEPRLKLFLAANHKPNIRGQDEGIWRRIKLIPFTQEVPETQRIPDKHLELLQEAPGILNWLIKGYQSWRLIGLAHPEKVVDATKEYRDEEDLLAPFLSERCVLDPQAEIQSRKLYTEYTRYCEESGVQHKMTHTSFSLNLAKRKGIEKKRTTKCVVFSGIRLVEEARQDAYFIE